MPCWRGANKQPLFNSSKSEINGLTKGHNQPRLTQYDTLFKWSLCLAYKRSSPHAPSSSPERKQQNLPPNFALHETAKPEVSEEQPRFQSWCQTPRSIINTEAYQKRIACLKKQLDRLAPMADPTNSFTCSLSTASSPVLTKSAPSIDPVVENDQQLPQDPWFFTSVTAPFDTQSTCPTATPKHHG